MSTERELLYKVLFDMRADINDLKRMISELMKGGVPCPEPVRDVKALLPTTAQSSYVPAVASYPQPPVYAESEKVTDEPPREMTKADMQREQIIRALRRNNGRRREAAAELFMSERTLYRKIKELGIGEAIRIIIQNLTGITGGARGLQGIPSGSPAWMVAVVLVTVVVFLANFKRSKLGRNCIAIREEPLAAAACGIDVFRHKLLAMAISCALCGLSGALLAHYMHYLVPTMFNMAKSNELIMTAILGGRGSITGTLIAGAVLIPLPEFLRFGSAQEWRMVLYGLLVVITIIFRPTGLVGGKEITPKAIRQFGMQMRQRLHRMNGVVRKGDGEHE